MATDQVHVSKAERLRRVMEIYPLVVDGLAFAQIKEVTSKKFSWSVPDRTLQRYIAQANALVAEQASYVRAEKFAQAAAFLERLRTRAAIAGDITRALAVQCELDRLYGLLAPDKHELAGGLALKGYVNLDEEEL
jgi:hypothetical protein